VGDATHQPIDAPALHVVQVLATTGVNADGSPKDPEVITDGATNVVPSSSIRLRFDRYLLPSSISRQAACLRSSTDPVTDYTKCNGGVFFQPSYDPVRREVVLRQQAGARLAPNTLYVLTLYQPSIKGDCTADVPTSCGILAFDRAPLEKAFTFQFKVTDQPPPKMNDETLPPAVFCGDNGAAVAIGQTCGYAGCHASSGDVGAAEGLSFYNLQFNDPTDTLRTAINRVAHQTQEGEAASLVEGTPARFGRAMPIIDAFAHDPAKDAVEGSRGNPGNSYLLYKVLVGMSMDGAPADIKVPDAEIARLRASVVVGLPMPPPDIATGPLTGDQLLNVSNWIAQGAPFPTCQ
jgi:hypothetical protein